MSIAEKERFSIILQYEDEMQAIQFFQNIPSDQRYQFASYRLRKPGFDIDVETPIYIAASRGSHQVVEMLLAAGADANAVTSDGDTPIYFAVLLGRHQVVQMLLAAGADKNVVTRSGYPVTMLQLAMENIRLWRCCFQLVLTRILLGVMEEHPSMLQLRMGIIK